MSVEYIKYMDYQLSTEHENIVLIISALLVALVVWYISRNNKKYLDAAKSNQVDSLVISDYKIQAGFIDVIKTAIIFSVTSYPLVVSALAILIIAAKIWPISFFWLVAIFCGLFIYWFFLILFFLYGNLFFRPYPQTIFYQELSGFFRRQGKYVWTIAHKPFLVVGAFGINGKITLPWSRVYDVRYFDGNKLLIKYRRRPRWLVKLLDADSFVLVVPESEQAKRVVDFWHSYPSKN